METFLYKNEMSRVSVLIPAYNEEPTISFVIEACKKSNQVTEVIVIDDGSTDNTSKFASDAGALVLEYGTNQGKAFALLYGAQQAKEDTLLLLDADLVGLSVEHVENLINPVLDGIADSTLGLFTGGRLKTDLAHAITPHLSGQRCLKKDFLLQLEEFKNARYGIEVAITRYLSKQNKKVVKVYLENVTHVMKEEKTGRESGFQNRLQMYKDIVKHIFKYKKIKKL